MTMVVDSSQWTGKPEEGAQPPILWGEYADEATRDAALETLRRYAAPQRRGEAGVAANAGQVEPPDVDPRGAEARTLRQNAVGMAMAGTAMAAAGVVIATGGAALPAVAAAAVAGAATGAAGEAIGVAAAPDTQPAAAPPATARGPVIGLHIPDAERRELAERLLRETGARRTFTG